MKTHTHTAAAGLQGSCVSLLCYDEQEPMQPSMRSHENVIHLCAGTDTEPIPCLTASSSPAGILYTYYTDESEAEARGREGGEKLRKGERRKWDQEESKQEGTRGTHAVRG